METYDTKREEIAQKGDTCSVKSSALECPICCEMLHLATETTCGHAFCDHCINRALITSGTCPVCRQYPFPLHPSFTLRRIIEDLNVPIQNENNEELRLALELTHSGQYADAIDHFSRITKSSVILYGNRAFCYIKLGMYFEALGDCDRAIAIEPNYAWLYICKAVCHEQLKDFSKAYAASLIAKRLDFKLLHQKELDAIINRLLHYVTPPKEKPQQLYFMPITHSFK